MQAILLHCILHVACHRKEAETGNVWCSCPGAWKLGSSNSQLQKQQMLLTRHTLSFCRYIWLAIVGSLLVASAAAFFAARSCGGGGGVVGKAVGVLTHLCAKGDKEDDDDVDDAEVWICPSI